MDITDEMVDAFVALQQSLGTKQALEYIRDLIKVQQLIKKKTEEVYGNY